MVSPLPISKFQEVLCHLVQALSGLSTPWERECTCDALGDLLEHIHTCPKTVWHLCRCAGARPLYAEMLCGDKDPTASQ